MFKLESYITPILMGYVDKYIKLRTEDFQLSLWGGDAVLYNLDLRLDVLEKAMQLPIVFQSGHIHELRLHIPWTKLGSEPVVVTINTIECILKLRDTAYSDKGSTKGGSEVSPRKSGTGQRQKSRRQEGEDLPPGYLQSLMNKIVNNVSIIVNNLIIKFVEDDIVFSMNMKSAEIYSVNKDWVRAFVELTPPDFILRRAINICDLTICLDKRDASGRIENYQDPLVYRCSVSSRLYMKYDGIHAKYPGDTKLDFYCDRLDLSMTDTQLPMFIRLVELGLALYYGTLEFKSRGEPAAEEPEKQKMAHEEQSETTEEGADGDDENQQGWGQWAWSFVPQILAEDEPDNDEVQERKKRTPSVFSLGTYAYKMSITFKLTEHTKEKAHYGPRKISFKPFLYLESEGISMDVVMQGLIYFNVQSGITNLRVFSQGNCICGARNEENSRKKHRSMAHRTTEWRRKIKLEDPDRYQRYLQDARERNKKNRDKLKQALQKKKPDKDSFEKKKHMLELQRQRQKVYLAKKKTEKTNENLIVKFTDSFQKKQKNPQTTPQNKPKTRHNVQARREYNRIKKQEERARQTYQKQIWIRKKDRERKQQKRECMLKSAKTPATSLPASAVTEAEAWFRSKKTEWNVTSQIRSQLPETPEKFAKVVDNLVQNATPRKRKAVEQLCGKRKKPRVITSGKHPKFRTAAYLIKRSFKRRRAVDVIGIQKFYMREDISQVMPNKRFATKDGPGYIMQVPIRSAHSKYLSENKDKRVSLAKFASLRKKNVRKLTKSHRNYCCCVYCMNIRFKLLTLSRALSDTTRKKINEGDLLDITLCPKADNERFHRSSCINGSCDKCGDYMKTLSEFYSGIGNQQVSWNRWEKVKGNDGKEKRVVITKKGTKDDLLMELVAKDIKNPSQGTTFFKHYFNAKWQTLQFQNMKKDLPDDNVLQVMDFAKNREIKYQDEIKATYYTANQVTLHPIVNFYKTDLGLVRESCVIISEDSKHDYHAVHHYQDLAKNHISEQTQLPPSRFLVWSDGCSSQYKSKGPFADLALEATKVNRNFFGSEHGKSECDGEIGVINQAIDRAILGNKVIINNAEDMFQYCKNHLEINEVLTKRKFFFVKENEICRDRPNTMMKTMPNTRKVHQICNLSKSQKCLVVRELSCFCKLCESEKDEECLNREYIKPYELKQLQFEDKARKTKRIPKCDPTVSDNIEENSQMKNAFENTGKKESTMPNERERSSIPKCGTKVSDKTEENLEEEKRSQFFSSILQVFAKCDIYHELEKKVEEASKEILATYGEINVNKDVNVVDQQLIGDANADSMMQSAPNYLPEELQGRIPVRVLGDGNCLPRTGSVLAFGHEKRYTEMRCRIVMELVRNKTIYLKLSHINQCLDPNFNAAEARDLLKTYCMFSEQYIPGTRTTRSTIVNVFEQEVMSICENKKFMGIWQIFALSSLLHCRLFSVYPDLGSALYRSTMNRLVQPIENRHDNVLAGVVWTSTRNDMTDRNWIPNHFVPLIPVSKPIDVEVVDLMFDDTDVMDTSVDSTIIDDIIINIKDSPDASFSEIPVEQEDLMASSTEQTNMDSILTQLPDQEERSPEQLDLDKPPPVNNDEMPAMESDKLEPCSQQEDLMTSSTEQIDMDSSFTQLPDQEERSPEQLDLDKPPPVNSIEMPAMESDKLEPCIQQEDLMTSSSEQTDMYSSLTQLPDQEERSPEQLDLDKPPPVNNDEMPAMESDKLEPCIQQEDLMTSSTEQTNMDSILTQLPDQEERSPEQLDLDKPPPVNNDEMPAMRSDKLEPYSQQEDKQKPSSSESQKSKNGHGCVFLKGKEWDGSSLKLFTQFMSERWKVLWQHQIYNCVAAGFIIISQNNILLSGGDALPNKTVTNYLTQSLFDSHSARNLGIPSDRVLDWDYHLEAYTEQHSLEKYGVVWTDYLYVLTKNEEGSVHGSRSSVSEHEETTLFAHENSLSRFVIGPCHLNIASTTVHRIQKIMDCAYKYDYEPYAKKHTEIVDDSRPHPTEDQMRSMEEFVPTRTHHLTLLRPVISLLSAEHAQCDIAKKAYHSKTRSSRGEGLAQKLYPLFGVQLSSERFDLQVMSPMYPRKLVQLVSKIAGPPSSLLHHCYSHTQMKLFGFHVGLTTVDTSGTRSPLLTVIPTTSGALYTRRLLLPMYWKNSYLPKIERVYELPQFTLSVSKAGLMVVIELLSSWQQKNPRPSDIVANTLMEDVFPTEEAEKKPMSILELTMSGFEMKSCRNDIVTACSGTVSSAQVLVHSSDGASTRVTPILSSSTYTEHLHTSDWLSLEDSSTLEDKNDCFTFTYQLPRKYDQIEVPAVVLVNMEGLAACLDPALLDWLQYTPRQKVVPTAEKKIDIDLDLAKAASPLQGNISQVSQASSGSTRQHTDSLTITHSLTPRTVTGTASQGDRERRKTENPDGWGESLAKIFPVIRLVQVQVEVKKMCLFLPKTHLQLPDPSVNIPQNLHRLARSRSLPDTVVVCLPHVTIQSAGHKPVSPLQEIPISSMEGSLVGDKIPWNVSLKNFSIYSLHQQSNSPWKALQLLKPTTVSSTVGVSYKYNPPTSDDISALGLCLHTDMHNVTGSISPGQVILLADLSSIFTKLGLRTISLLTDISGKFSSSDKTTPVPAPRLPPTPEPLPGQQTLTSVTSHTEGDGLVTETSYDLGSMDTTPSRELEILEDVGGGVKLSLWLQWTLPRCELRLYCVGKEDQKVSLLLEDITMSIDVNEIYSKLKMNLGAANIDHVVRASSSDNWQQGPKNGIIMNCRGNLSHDTHILSTRLWSADHVRGALNKASVKINSNQREVTHGFMNLTFTRALRKNVKKRFQKLNIDIPALQDPQTETDIQFYFHKYVSEICVTVSPCDFVVCFSAIQNILGSFSSFEHGQKIKPVSRTPSQPKAHLERRNKEPKPFMTSSNLPLIYADFSCVRVFIPREKTPVVEQSKGDNMKTTLNQDLLMLQMQSISISPQADNPLPRYPIRKDLWQRAVQLGVTSQPGSALLDRQYQIDLSGFSLSTGCWEGFVTKATSAQPPSSTPGTQIPALEWNALQSLYKDHEEIQLFPIVAACEMKLVAAPSVVHIQQNMEEVLVCGHSIELNITSDLDLHASTNQIHLIQKLVSDLLRCLTPPSDASYELLDDMDSVKDSGIGSDVSASTMATVKDTQQGSSEGKVRSKVMTPFNILLTAGRISCMLYSHKIAENDIKLGDQHVKTEVDKKSLSHKFEWEVDSNEESNGYDDDEGFEHVDAEAEFEEFSFMNIHESSVYDNEVKVIAKGSNYVQPFVYFYLSQPHLILSCRSETQKFEMSCYDILVKGPTENALFQAMESKLLPDCSDYTVYWLETRAGQPDLTTGIPPCLYTLRITDFFKEPAGFSLKFERPVKLNLSLSKLGQVQQLIEALFPERPAKRSKVNVKDESSRSSESKSPGVQAILNKVKHFELQTDQVVVAMETQLCDHSPGLNASFTSFTIEAVLQHNTKGELDKISSTSYVRDLYLQTKYDRRLSSLLGPFSVKIDGTFSHCCYDNKHFLSQSLVTIATGLVVINVGQEHVLCLDLIAKHLQDLIKDSCGATEHQSAVRKVKLEPVAQPSEAFIVHKSVDDLRSGSYQYRVDSASSGVLPGPGEIMFCNGDKDGNSSMTWSYSHPRLISYIRAMPIPFNVSREETEEQIRVYCSLQYWEELVQQFVDYAELEISETDITYADLPDVRTSSSRDLVVSSVWRLVIRTADQPVVLPTSLAASVKIDSCFIPSLIPSLQVGCTLESLEVHLSNHLHCLGSKTPTRLEPFYMSSCGPASEEFALLTVDNILCAGAQFRGQQAKTSLQFSAQAMLEVLEYKMLTMQKLLAPCDISGVASIQPKPKPAVVDLDVSCDKVDLRVGRGVVHTLSTSLQAWNQTISHISAGNHRGSRTSHMTGGSNQTGSRTVNQTGSGAGSQEYQPLFGHYVLCNDTQRPIRFGQAGTDENLVLPPREMQSYSWRSHKVKQSLHVCVDGSTWKWCQPFNISETGTLVRKVTSLQQNYTLIIRITRLSNVQNQIIISGQLHVSNRLDLPVEVKVVAREGSHDQRSVGQSGHTIPSYILEMSEVQGIKFHCPGRNNPWSKEVYIVGEKLQENNLVKVILCPLYIIRSHLPSPININIDTSKLNIHRQIQAPGQGSDLQLQCAGGDIHHSVTFQFSKNSAKSSSGVTLSTGLIDQLSRSEVMDTEFDSLYNFRMSRCQLDWPYCRESRDSDQIIPSESFSSTQTIPDNSDTQPTIDLNISLSELWPGCSTVLVDVTPWCLFTNLSDLDLVLMGSEDRTFRVSQGNTISPPKIEGSFHVGVQYNDHVFMSAPIPVSEEEVGAQRYRNDVGKTLYLDSWVHMPVFTDHQERVCFLTITSSVQHQIRTISVRERYCLTNYTKLDLSASISAVPRWSDKVDPLLQPNLTVSRHQSGDPGISDLQRITFLPITFSRDTKNRKDIDHNTAFILYLMLQHNSEETDSESKDFKSDWSFPLRMTANENGCRMTGSVQVSKGDHSESKPLCITGHVKKSVTYFVIREDAAPACLIKNKCPFKLLFGQTLMNLSMSGATIQEQTELVQSLPSLASDREVYYTPPSINNSFPEIIDKKSFPKLHLSGIKSDSSELLHSSGIAWSKPVDLLVAADTFVKIPDLADVRVHVQQVALVTHVTIEPITKAEVSAKEIRSRLKGKETTVLIESKPFGLGSEIIKDLKEELSEKTHKKDELFEDSKRQGKAKDPAHQYNVGLFVRQFSLIVQNELTSPEIQGELLRVTADDIFAAWYPASAMLEDHEISRNCFVVSAGDLQLDNQIHDQGKYDFPVVLVRQNYERPRTVHDYDQLMQMSIIEKHAILKSTSVLHAQVVLSSFRNRNNVLESVELTAKPLSFYVDDTFVFQVIKEIEGFIPTQLSFPEALPVTLLKLPPSVKSSSKTGSCPIRIGHLSIEQLSLLMSVHASLKLFIASDHTPLTFGTFEKSNLFTTGHQLTRVVVMHYASGALFKAGAVVGSLEILGNPTGLVRSIGTGVADFFRMPYRGLTKGPGAFVVGISSGTSSMVKNITTGMLTSITNFASSVSRNMDRLSLDSSHEERQEETRRHRPDGVSEGLKQGLTGLGLSVLGAIAGLADQPIQNIVSQMTDEERRPSRTATAGSLMTGVGKGLVGVITKPIGGAAEFVSQTGQGILHGTGLSQPPKPKCKNGSIASEANCGQTKYAQKLLQSIPSCDILFSTEAGFVDITDIVKPVTLILTPEILFVISHEDDIQQQAYAVEELECGVKIGETAVLTIIWRDSFTDKLDEPRLTNEDRVAAFIDSTILPARVRRDSFPTSNRKNYSLENSPAKLTSQQDTVPVSLPKQGALLQLPETSTVAKHLQMVPDSKVTKQQGTLLQLAEASVVARQQGTLLKTAEAVAVGQPLNSVINEGQLSDSDSSSSVIGDSISMATIPQYDFHISAPKLAAFLAIFNITKRKLEGTGFAL